MALLALMLLTAVGLTLATSTSTEVQVAANYRWSLQALYNAEAGVEVAKNLLVGADWTAHPKARTIADWDPSTNTISPPAASDVETATRTTTVTRDFEMGRCDAIGNGMGYGVIMPDNLTATAGGAALENRTTYATQTLNGAFTVWYRKPHVYNTNGTVRDFGKVQADRDNYADVVVVVSEGVAPYSATGTTDTNASAFMAGVHATQIVEATLYGPPTIPACEADLNSQAGGGPGGAGLDPCSSAAASFDITRIGVDVGTATGNATRRTR